MKVRISVLIPLLLVVSSLVTSAIVFFVDMRQTTADIERQGKEGIVTHLTQLQNMLDTQLAQGDIEDARLSMSVSSLHPGIETLLLANQNNTVLLANRYAWEGEQAHVATQYDSFKATEARNRRSSIISFNDHRDMLTGYFPVTLRIGASESDKVGMLYVKYSLKASLAESRYHALQKSGYFAGLMLVISVVVALLLHNIVSRRVVQLMAAAKQFAYGNHDVRVQLRGNDELAELGSAFDLMAAMREKAYLDLGEEQERFRVMLEASPVAVGIASKGGRKLVFANKSYAALINMEPENFKGVDPRVFYSNPQDHEEIAREIAAGHEVINKLVCLKIPGDGEKWVMASYLPTKFGGESAVLGWFYDFTARKQLEDELHLAAAVFENAQEAILVTDAQNRIISVNPAFTRVTGYAPEAVMGKNPRVLSSGRHDEEFYEGLYLDLATKGYWQGEIWDKRSDGTIYPKWLSIGVIKDNNGELKNYIATFRDITERKEAEEKIEYLAQHDPLTGLPNRLLLHDRFDHAVAVAERDGTGMAMMFLDLDNFKHINDSFGHEAGDKLLISIAERLGGCIREADTVCRQGGDEFIILLQEVNDVNVISRIAQNILDTVDKPYELDGNLVTATFSIGISLYPNDGMTFGVLQKRADTAMYHAKESGRNLYRFFDEKMNVDSLERFNLLNHLRDALQKQEFTLFYQPQIDIHSGHVTSVEALIRWQHDDLGLVYPARFIHVAEESGLIVQIGEWVLQEACRQLKLWHESGLPKISVAVNLSSLQFKRGNIFDTVLKALSSSGLDAKYLELELTESILLHDIDEVMEAIQKLKYLGVKISIDDFGTGYSSMSYLKQLKVDKLKIDKSFVRDLTDDSEDAAIAKAIIQLGESLQLKIVAEGVETKAQLEFLRNHGCHEAQGYFFSRPVAADKAANFFRSRMKELGAPHLFSSR
jgi:diguanylate cyclase (GGDEF)-like protein/PAS domain S-box-containing protein